MNIGEGRVVAGRYRLATLLGRGGMGEVWRAEHLTLHAPVALKLIDLDQVTQGDAASRFLREAQAAAALRSPHIVQVFDYGVDDGLPFMAMELLDGESLSTRLARVGRLAFAEMQRIVTQVARAVTRAHQVGIVHRDLKPDNIFLVAGEDDELVKVLDFGIAKLTTAPLDQAAPTRTVTGLMLGTPSYMSPEQVCETDKVDHRADLWALGVIAFECVTGQRPFRGRALGELLVQICTAPVPVPSSLAQLPPGFDHWFARATERNLARRFQSAREMVESLRTVAGDVAPPASAPDAGTATVARMPAPSGFDAIRSFGAPRSNLPAEATAFVGRRIELRQTAALVAESRLVTLTGPGGTGKTRLALRSAAQLLEEFPDGVYFVPLAEINDASLLGSAIAAALTMPPPPADRPVLEAIGEHLVSQRVLLVLDNLEQISDVAADIDRLLEAAAGLHVIATSRAPVGLPREHVFAVPPLETPTAGAPADPVLLASVDGVALFVRRAREVNPSFALTTENAGAVAQIVTRLEGLPLALELAAARVALFPPAALARRLERGFELLRATTSELPERHRTLHATVAWSYDLLNDAERAALQRLGVFAGGFTLDAASAVIGTPPADDVVALFASLVDKSLVRRDRLRGDDRFSMLEPIREFAREALEKSGDAQRLRRRHAARFLAVTEECEPELRRAGHDAARLRLEADEANIREALRFCLAVGDADTGLGIAGAVWRFWQSAGRLGEGRRWLSDLLDLPGSSLPRRAKGLSAVAGLAYWQGEYADALAHYRAARELYERSGDAFGVAESLFGMSTASSWGGDATAGARLATEALGRFEQIGAREQVGMVHMAQGFARWMQGDLAGARPLWESSIEIAREVGDHVEAAHKRLALASITFQEGQHERAVTEALDAMEELQTHGNVPLTIMALDWIAALAAERSPEQCVCLAGAVAELRRTLGGGMRPEACGLTSARDVAARLLDPAVLDHAWRSGMRMSLDEAVDYARALRPQWTMRPPDSPVPASLVTDPLIRQPPV